VLFVLGNKLFRKKFSSEALGFHIPSFHIKGARFLRHIDTGLSKHAFLLPLKPAHKPAICFCGCSPAFLHAQPRLLQLRISHSNWLASGSCSSSISAGRIKGEQINFLFGFMVHGLLLSRPLSLPRRGGSCCSLRCLSSSCSCLCCSSFCSFSRSSCCCLMARSSCCNLHRTKIREKVQFALFSRSALAKQPFE